MEPRRYTVRSFPQAKVGRMVTVSVKLPEAWRDLFDGRIAQLAQAENPQVKNRNEALQDAVMRWLIMEGVE